MTSQRNWKKYIGLVGILFLFPLFWLLFFGIFSNHNFRTLKYFGPEATQGAEYSDYTLPGFAFANQDGEMITLDSLKGKVWLAAFYSTTDEHAAKITERLLNVNFKYRDEPDIYIVTFSTNCEADTPPIVQNYVQQLTKYNGFGGKWQYLTGDQAAMQSYFRNGFFIQDISSEPIFRLIDSEGHVRGLYGNTEYHIRDAMEDIALLKKEMDKKRYDERKANDQ